MQRLVGRRDTQLAAARAEIESLKHDLSRHLSITSEQATEILGKDKEIGDLKRALGTEQSMHGAWRKRAEEAELALNNARNIEAEAISAEIESLYKSANEQWNNALTSVRNIITAGTLARALQLKGK